MNASNVVLSADRNTEKHLEEFLELLRIPSISTLQEYRDQVKSAAVWIAAKLEAIGLDSVRVIETEGQPLVVAQNLDAGAQAKTLLLYAHFDVQPTDPPQLWESAPFEPDIREGRLYARGVVDDKIGVYAIIAAIESFANSGVPLPVNIRILFEGEEEVGSPSAPLFLQNHRNELDADLLVLCDGSFASSGPEITYTARGLVGGEITVIGPERDLHSGFAGGLVRNPIHVLSEIIASIHDSSGNVAIPGFYDNAIPLTETERRYFGSREMGRIKRGKELTGDFELWGDEARTVTERGTAMPCCDVNGIFGGYQDPGFKTVLPAVAGCKVSLRLAPGQDPDTMAELFTGHVLRFSDKTAHVSVTLPKRAWPIQSEFDSQEVNSLKAAFKAAWKTPALARGGGSIPIGGLIQHELGMPILFAGLGVGGSVHSPNEFMDLDYFPVAIDTMIHLIVNLADREKTG